MPLAVNKRYAHVARPGGQLAFACNECTARFDAKGFVAAACAYCAMPIYFCSLAEANEYIQNKG